MLEIELANICDVSEIARLEEVLFSDPWSESMIGNCLEQKHYRVIVCLSRSESVSAEAGLDITAQKCVVGYLISIHVAGEAELLRIGVEPAAQRRGIGRLLMNVFAQHCAEAGTREVYLEVRASNRPAIALYEQFGFEAVGTRKKYYHHPEEDACLMAGMMHVPRNLLAFEESADRTFHGQQC